MRIVIGVDESRESELACSFVATRAWPIGTRVILLAALAPRVDWATAVGSVGVDVIGDEQRVLAALLEDRADVFRRAAIEVQTETASGPAGNVLMIAAGSHFADMIVVGSQRRGPVSSAILGSVSAALVDHAPCPVLVVRRPTASRMLVATDGTRSSQSIPRILASWGAAFRDLPVEVLSVAPRNGFVTPWAANEPEDDPNVEDLAFHRDVAQHVADELMDLGWHSAAITRAGEPDREIVREGDEWGADLIVTGSRGIGTLHRLLTGSVAHDVLLHTTSSVLVVRGQVPAPIGAVRVTPELADA